MGKSDILSIKLYPLRSLGNLELCWIPCNKRAMATSKRLVPTGTMQRTCAASSTRADLKFPPAMLAWRRCGSAQTRRTGLSHPGLRPALHARCAVGRAGKAMPPTGAPWIVSLTRSPSGCASTESPSDITTIIGNSHRRRSENCPGEVQ